MLILFSEDVWNIVPQAACLGPGQPRLGQAGRQTSLAKLEGDRSKRVMLMKFN